MANTLPCLSRRTGASLEPALKTLTFGSVETGAGVAAFFGGSAFLASVFLGSAFLGSVFFGSVFFGSVFLHDHPARS